MKVASRCAHVIDHVRLDNKDQSFPASVSRNLSQHASQTAMATLTKEE